MWIDLAAGTFLVGVTVLIHSVGLFLLSKALRWGVTRYSPHRNNVGTMAALGATVLGLFLIHTVEIWVWAAAYYAVGAIDDFHTALVFSTLSSSTLGAEPVSVAPEWRLFGSIEGVNGFLLIGWSTAYLIPAWTRHGPFHEDRGL